ncbi:MAG: hypothetical protein EPO08_11240 [Rhodospirillaceae bacterium]|nr:MAG: hypothetical protein EPO08_11240 [Rhodospirillaceae bacterium]
MDLAYSEEQLLFRQSLERYLGENYSFAHRRHVAAKLHGFDPEVWAGLAELGCFGVPLTTEHGGFDGRLVTTGLVMQALGRHLVVEPVLGSAVIAGRLIARVAHAAQRDELLTPLIAGTSRIAFAHDDLGTKASLKGGADGYRLTARKTAVLGGATADRLLVSALNAAGELRLAILDAGTSGVSLHPYQLLDGSWAADVLVQDVTIGSDRILGDGSDAGPAITATLDDGVVAACWEAVGAMQAAYEQTCAYVRERRQFDRPLAGFQVVQHKVAEMAVCCEEAGAAALLAALKLDSEGADRDRAVAAAKVRISHCGRFVAKEAVQLHGGMGVSEELPIATYFRKLLTFELMFGSSMEYRRRYVKTVIAARAHEMSAVLPAAERADITLPAA